MNRLLSFDVVSFDVGTSFCKFVQIHYVAIELAKKVKYTTYFINLPASIKSNSEVSIIMNGEENSIANI